MLLRSLCFTACGSKKENLQYDKSTITQEFHNGHNVIAFVGSYDEKTHTFTREQVQLMDGGIDFYATQTTQAPDGRRLMTAWLQTWSDTEDKPQGCKWFGQTICPRELRLKDGHIVQTPVRELDAAHGKRTLHEDVTVQRSEERSCRERV